MRIQAFEFRRDDGFRWRSIAQQNVVEAGAFRVFGDAEAGGGVALGSESMTRTRKSLAAREAAKLMAVVVFPTPPF